MATLIMLLLENGHSDLEIEISISSWQMGMQANGIEYLSNSEGQHFGLCGVLGFFMTRTKRWWGKGKYRDPNTVLWRVVTVTVKVLSDSMLLTLESGINVPPWINIATHTTYSWYIKWLKCARMGLNGFIFKKIKLN